MTTAATVSLAAGLIATTPVQADEPRDCLKLRKELGWSRAEYRTCHREAMQQNIARLDADFARMKAWLQARGLDVNDAGHITDPKGRTLAKIEASNAVLAEGNADLAEGNAALRANIKKLDLRIQTADAEYRRILAEFSRTALRSTK